MGVALLAAAVIGLLVSARYLLLAYLLRERGLALIAAATLVVFVIAALTVMAAWGVL
jgi:hypothetical protein